MVNSFYFQHDYNARNDQKILELRAEYGAEGYGIWWMLLETIAEQDEGVKRGALGGLKLAFGVDKETLEGVINLCLELGLLYESNGYLRNTRMDEHKTLRDKFKEAGRKGGKKSKKSSSPKDNGDGDKKGGLKPPPKQGKESKGKESIKNTLFGCDEVYAVTNPTKEKLRPIVNEYGYPKDFEELFYLSDTKTDKIAALTQWVKLSESEREKVKEHWPEYAKLTTGNYQKYFRTYLSDMGWETDLESLSKNSKQKKIGIW